MGRNNAGNIKSHNDKLHKAKAKKQQQKVERAALLKALNKKINDSKND